MLRVISRDVERAGRRAFCDSGELDIDRRRLQIAHRESCAAVCYGKESADRP